MVVWITGVVVFRLVILERSCACFVPVGGRFVLKQAIDEARFFCVATKKQDNKFVSVCFCYDSDKAEKVWLLGKRRMLLFVEYQKATVNWQASLQERKVQNRFVFMYPTDRTASQLYKPEMRSLRRSRDVN